MLSLICLSEAVYLSSAQFPWWLQAQLSVPGVRYRRSKDQRKGWQAFFVRGGESLIDGCLPLSGRIIRRHGQDRRWSPGANSSGVVSAISRQTLFPGVTECAKKIMILIFLRCETAVVPFIAQHTGQTKWNLQLVWLTVKAPKAFSCQTTASIGNRDAAERLHVVTALWPAFLHQKMFWWKKNPPNNFHLFYYVSYILSMPSFKPMAVYYLLTLRW